MLLATAAVTAWADHESSGWLFSSYSWTQPKFFAGRGAAFCLMVILCVGILTLQPIKTLIYLAEKPPPKKPVSQISVPAVYEGEFLNMSGFFSPT